MGKKAAEELLEAIETGGTVDKYIQVICKVYLTILHDFLSSGPNDYLHGAGRWGVEAALWPSHSSHRDCNPHCRETNWSQI